MGVAVRRIQPDDWPLLRDLRLASLRDAPEAFGQRLDEAATFDDRDWMSTARASARGYRRAWFIAWDENEQPVGVVQARRRLPDTCLLFSMWVAPSVRRQGAGRALVQAVDDWGRSWGAARIVLWVLSTNEGAHRFYEQIDFHVVRQGADAESGAAYGALAMERRLEG
jgi:GNAT superfamily N-acetyltransferase